MPDYDWSSPDARNVSLVPGCVILFYFILFCIILLTPIFFPFSFCFQIRMFAPLQQTVCSVTMGTFTYSPATTAYLLNRPVFMCWLTNICKVRTIIYKLQCLAIVCVFSET